MMDAGAQVVIVRDEDLEETICLAERVREEGDFKIFKARIERLAQEKKELLSLLDYVIEDLIDGLGDEIEAKHMRERVKNILK